MLASCFKVAPVLWVIQVLLLPVSPEQPMPVLGPMPVGRAVIMTLTFELPGREELVPLTINIRACPDVQGVEPRLTAHINKGIQLLNL